MVLTRTPVPRDTSGYPGTPRAAAIAIVERVDDDAIDAGILVGIDEVRVAGMVPVAAEASGRNRLHE
jgi:hypothetical protein